jgi:hypothetical protein
MKPSTQCHLTRRHAVCMLTHPFGIVYSWTWPQGASRDTRAPITHQLNQPTPCSKGIWGSAGLNSFGLQGSNDSVTQGSSLTDPKRKTDSLKKTEKKEKKKKKNPELQDTDGQMPQELKYMAEEGPLDRVPLPILWNFVIASWGQVLTTLKDHSAPYIFSGFLVTHSSDYWQCSLSHTESPSFLN